MIFLNTPKFWYKPANSVLRALNRLAVPIYRCIKSNKYKFEPSIETIAIGGVTVGGAGKTPVAKYIYQTLVAKGRKPVICLRGYGRNSADTIVVDPKKHKFKEVGDEALLLAKYAQVIVSANRKSAHDTAVSLGADVLILDDGFEQRDIRPNKRVLVIDGFQGIGNGLLLPFGPLRDTLQNSTQKSDVIILLNADIHNLSQILPNCIHAHTLPDFTNIPHDIIAFSGLGMNEKFFASLRDHFNLIATFGFPDHYPYTEDDILKMLASGSPLVTTEKDYQRIPEQLKQHVRYIPIDLRCDDEWI